MRLSRLIVETWLPCAAGAATSGQATASETHEAPAVLALAPGGKTSGAKPPADTSEAVIPSNEGYAGNAQCKTGRPDIRSGFYKNPHFKSMASGKRPPELAACEGRHGPAKAHIHAGGAATPAYARLPS